MSQNIHIQANGKTFETAAKTLPEFLTELNLAPERVVVERNKVALTPTETRSTELSDGDCLEIVNIVAGG